jgi:hypothetical protein
VALALRRSTPLAIAFAAYMAFAGGALAAGYETGNATPFVALGATLAPIAIVARAWGAASSPHLALRAARAALSASAVFAAAFLLLERLDRSYLEGFGL